MNSMENREVRGADRLVLHSLAGALALSALVHPTLLAAQQARPATQSSANAATSGRPATGIGPEGIATRSAELPTVAQSASPDPTTTATVDQNPVTFGPAADRDALPLDESLGRQNMRETRLDDVTAARIRRDALQAEDGTGIRLGTLVLRPSISQKLGTEGRKTGNANTDRTFSETGLKGTLTSDWSRHELNVGAEGAWQETLSGTESDKPRANIDARLRLDLAEDTIATLSGSYSFSREDNDDPNAVSGARVQSGVNQFGGGLSVERDFGVIRGSIAGDVTRFQYSNATLSNGSILQRSDRDRNRYSLSARLGYELSPALTPFIEGTIGRIDYDEEADSSGYRRSADLYGVKTGVAVDLGEKLRGEIAIGHEQQTFEDGRLAKLSALTVDGNILWSPREGTTIDLALDTSIDPSTTAGVNGATIHRLTANLSNDLRTNLVARLTGGTTFTRYDGTSSASDTTAYLAGAGLTWKVNRYLDATADLTYERTNFETGSHNSTVTALVGLTAKR